jgi:hypothetical protein
VKKDGLSHRVLGDVLSGLLPGHRTLDDETSALARQGGIGFKRKKETQDPLTDGFVGPDRGRVVPGTPQMQLGTVTSGWSTIMV